MSPSADAYKAPGGARLLGIRESNQALAELKTKLEFALSRLNDQDTQRTGVEEIREFLQTLYPDWFPMVISCIGEAGANLKPLGRCESVKLLGLMAELHGEAVVPLLQRILQVVVTRLQDADLHLRDACAETVFRLARALVLDVEGGLHVFATLLKPLFGALSEHNKWVQIGSASCICAVIQGSPAAVLAENLGRLCSRLVQHLSLPLAMARPQLLSACIHILQAVEGPEFDEVLPSLLPCLESCLNSSSDWQTRKQAVEVLQTIGDHPELGQSMQLPPPTDLSVRPTPLQRRLALLFDSLRDDKVRAVREAVKDVLLRWSITTKAALISSSAASAASGAGVGGAPSPVGSDPLEATLRGRPNSIRAGTVAVNAPGPAGVAVRSSSPFGAHSWAPDREAPAHRLAPPSRAASGRASSPVPVPVLSDQARLGDGSSAAAEKAARSAAVKAALSNADLSSTKKPRTKLDRVSIFNRPQNSSFFQTVSNQQADEAEDLQLAEEMRFGEEDVQSPSGAESLERTGQASPPVASVVSVSAGPAVGSRKAAPALVASRKAADREKRPPWAVEAIAPEGEIPQSMDLDDGEEAQFANGDQQPESLPADSLLADVGAKEAEIASGDEDKELEELVEEGGAEGDFQAEPEPVWEPPTAATKQAARRNESLRLRDPKLSSAPRPSGGPGGDLRERSESPPQPSAALPKDESSERLAVAASSRPGEAAVASAFEDHAAETMGGTVVTRTPPASARSSQNAAREGIAELSASPSSASPPRPNRQRKLAPQEDVDFLLAQLETLSERLIGLEEDKLRSEEMMTERLQQLARTCEGQGEILAAQQHRLEAQEKKLQTQEQQLRLHEQRMRQQEEELMQQDQLLQEQQLQLQQQDQRLDQDDQQLKEHEQQLEHQDEDLEKHRILLSDMLMNASSSVGGSGSAAGSRSRLRARSEDGSQERLASASTPSASTFRRRPEAWSDGLEARGAPAPLPLASGVEAVPPAVGSGALAGSSGDRPTIVSMEGATKGGVPQRQNPLLWDKVLELCAERRFLEAYKQVIAEPEESCLLRLMQHTGPIVDRLDAESNSRLIRRLIHILSSPSKDPAATSIEQIFSWLWQALNQGIHFTASQVEDLNAALQRVSALNSPLTAPEKAEAQQLLSRVSALRRS
ncbi:unnamed protein product [Polarella glacialis]|uniref:TOG domain-containing protein n=1 Tax=Polarella glacialis TaxID=89957 RepID=A0A813EVP1_POLGL|nr:unnamed protein product [Polarella glacialis]